MWHRQALTTHRYSPVPPEPYTKRIAFTGNSVTFSQYGRPISITPVADVMQQASLWISTNIDAHGSGGIVPIKSAEFPHGPRWVASGTIELVLQPLFRSRMTWHDLANLIRELYDFVRRYGQFEFRVEMSNTSSGLLGFGHLNYTEGPLLNIEATNNTKPFVANLTTLPPDPMTFQVPNSGISIEFSNIGQAIPANDVGSCLFQALFSIIEVLVDEGGDAEIEKGEQTPISTFHHQAISMIYVSHLLTYEALQFWSFIRALRSVI